jgi:hypothetical protein
MSTVHDRSSLSRIAHQGTFVWSPRAEVRLDGAISLDSHSTDLSILALRVKWKVLNDLCLVIVEQGQVVKRREL